MCLYLGVCKSGSSSKGFRNLLEVTGLLRSWLTLIHSSCDCVALWFDDVSDFNKSLLHAMIGV